MINDYGLGWAFYKTNDQRQAPVDIDNLEEWIQGFCAALAEYNDDEYDSIETALVGCGVSGKMLDDVLFAAEQVNSGEIWCRWPNLQIRIHATR